jgi:hypothetical protein
MFHEEKVINGVLCWRGTPNGEWIPFTMEQLTRKLIEEKEISKTLCKQKDELLELLRLVEFRLGRLEDVLNNAKI